MWKPFFWLSRAGRQQQLENALQQDEPAYFGFESVTQDEKTTKVIRHFDSVARHYDIMNTLLSFAIHLIWKRIAVNMLQLQQGAKVLDVCGGTGDLSILAARKTGPTGKVVLFDLNWDMMAAGYDKVRKAKNGHNVAYVQGNAEKIGLRAETFDAAMVGFGIRNVTRMKLGFEEMFRVLKPGGKILCLEFSKPTAPVFRWLYDFYSFYIMPWLGEVIVGSRQAYVHLPESIRMFPMPAELSKMLADIGFRKIRYRRLTNGIAVAHIAEKPAAAKPTPLKPLTG